MRTNNNLAKIYTYYTAMVPLLDDEFDQIFIGEALDLEPLHMREIILPGESKEKLS